MGEQNVTVNNIGKLSLNLIVVCMYRCCVSIWRQVEYKHSSSTLRALVVFTTRMNSERPCIVVPPQLFWSFYGTARNFGYKVEWFYTSQTRWRIIVISFNILETNLWSRKQVIPTFWCLATWQWVKKVNEIWVCCICTCITFYDWFVFHAMSDYCHKCSSLYQLCRLFAWYSYWTTIVSV